MEQRKHPRYSTEYSAWFSSPQIPSGEGQVINLSLRGCGLRTSVEMKPGTALQVRIQVPPNELPIQIDRAIVQWHITSYVGVEFVALSPQDDLCLQQVITRLKQQPGHPL